MRRMSLLVLSLTFCPTLYLNAGTDLNKAAIRGNLSNVMECVAAGEGIDDVDKYGWTALMWATYYQHLSVVKYLIERGANTNIQSTAKYSSFPEKTSALHLAAYYGITQIVMALIYGNANPELQDGNGKRSVDFAIEYKFSQIISFLDKKERPIPPK